MRGNELLGKMELVDPAYVEAAGDPQKRKRPAWVKWGALAACLCVLLILPVFLAHPVETPQKPESGDGPPSLVVEGIVFYISPHFALSQELPTGFSYAGEADVGGFENCSYYVNPDMPEWVYVYQEVLTDGTVDSTGSLTRTEPHHAYVRYVDERLRGKDLVSYHGSYYISLWSAQCYGDQPDVNAEYYDSMETRYGIRIKGDAPESFSHVGTAEFSGYDTIPSGTLSSNQGTHEIYFDANEPDVLLVSTSWYTAPDENGETRHEGFNVYIRYDCPLA